MSVVPVIRAPDERLHKVCDKVTDIDAGRARDLAADLVDTMISYNGMGLAAPQIGVHLRVICIKRKAGSPLVMINPKIIRRGNEVVRGQEGCLSMPGKMVSVKRHRIVTVEWFSPSGEPQESKLTNMDARCAQHEIDHLDGILITDQRYK